MTNDKILLHIFQCQRKFQLEAHSERLIVKNLTSIDPSKDFLLFPECKSCKLGKRAMVLKSRTPPFEYYEIRGCTLKNIGLKERNNEQTTN